MKPDAKTVTNKQPEPIDVVFHKTFYNPQAGCFNAIIQDAEGGRYESNTPFRTCREIFHRSDFNTRTTRTKNYKKNTIAFSHSSGQRQKIIDFIGAIEDKLGIEADNKTTFSRMSINGSSTARANILLVHVS